MSVFTHRFNAPLFTMFDDLFSTSRREFCFPNAAVNAAMVRMALGQGNYNAVSLLGFVDDRVARSWGNTWSSQLMAFGILVSFRDAAKKRGIAVGFSISLNSQLLLFGNASGFFEQVVMEEHFHTRDFEVLKLTLNCSNCPSPAQRLILVPKNDKCEQCFRSDHFWNEVLPTRRPSFVMVKMPVPVASQGIGSITVDMDMLDTSFSGQKIQVVTAVDMYNGMSTQRITTFSEKLDLTQVGHYYEVVVLPDGRIVSFSMR